MERELTIGQLIDVIDDCADQLEKRSAEIADENEDYLVETARRLQSLASHFGPMLGERFPHVPDEVLVEKPFHTMVQWPEATGPSDGSALPVFFSAGGPMPAVLPGRVLAGEVEEAGADEEER